jgi:hypothetical protein
LSTADKYFLGLDTVSHLVQRLSHAKAHTLHRNC